MKSLITRITAALLALVAVAVLAGATARSADVVAPDKLVILSTVDVKGKTSPCG
ncbi:MAG: hypothetical protein IT348_19730 [Candidatus Eisenbacteria bacterium]|jgi:hypothetical protein|nr:hypothetical protein [Candidatus Eisenbacteria bacterium]